MSPPSILTISIARHLVGHDVNHVLDKAWLSPNISASTRSRFLHVGFNLSVDDNTSSIEELEQTLTGRDWDGLIVGWCIRSHPEFTELFELVVTACMDYVFEGRGKGRDPKIMFCSGPGDLVNATLRSFPATQN